jgi:uncharacterized glyoxalase superfamily protein PhnB
MRLYRSDAGWQQREKDIRADAVIVSMSPTKVSLGAVASLQSPPPFQPSKIIVPRIVIGGVILDQPAGGEIGAVGVGSLAGTLGFSKRSIMNGSDGKPIHAELALRGTTLMLGPENPALGKRSAKTLGASPAGLFLYVENVDKIVAKAVSLGATAQGQVMDMFWGDSLRSSSGPRGMVGTRKAESTLQGNEKENDGANGERPVRQPRLEQALT